MRASWYMQLAEKLRGQGTDYWKSLKDRDTCADDDEKSATDMLRAAAKIGMVLHAGRIV